MILGTKCPSMISICNQFAPLFIVFVHSAPRLAKSAERIDGAIIAGGDMVEVEVDALREGMCVSEVSFGAN